MRKEVTKTYYDKTLINGLPAVLNSDIHTQRQRIVHVTYEERYDGDDQTFDHATHYSYDIHGNVETLLQDNKKMVDNFPSLASQRIKRMDYSYDLVSGNVHRMSVQNGEADQWHHAYTYDADNRIKQVYTNTHDPLTGMFDFTQNKQAEFTSNADWQNDGFYYYYDHGPLARLEIGQNTLQGVDYYYNLQGWLKGVNSSVLTGQHDPGKDSDQNSLNGFFGKDVIGFGLHYYEGDYTAIGGATPQTTIDNASHAGQNSYDLYNGNIRFMQTTITNPLTRDSMPMLNAYKYDQLNRLNESRSYENGLTSNEWNPSTYNDEYFNSFTYDAMGNIKTQNRHLRDGTQIEDLTYRYQKDASGSLLLRNRLYHLNDSIANNVDSTDIDDMGTFYSDNNIINTDNNYSYDAEGRLVKDRQEEIDTIIWTVSGKVKEIRRDLGSDYKNVIFDYDAMGNRIAKHIYDNEAQMLVKSTYYILDAQGNQMSMYEHLVSDTAVNYYLAERNIYGSSRLGTTNDTINMFLPNTLPSYGVVGNRNYELSNHLGNVLSVVNDIIYPLTDQNQSITSYEVGLSQVSDYSPFGVQLDGRTISNGDYRYGFNGMEKDDNVKGLGNSYTTEFRQYDPRVGRWLSIDPLFKNFPWQSPYVAFDNNPIVNNDPKGAAAENQSGGPGKKKDRLQEKETDLRKKAREIPLKIENPILHKINNWRKKRLENKADKIGDRINKIGKKLQKQGGDKLSARFNTGQNGGTSGTGAGSDDNTLPPPVPRPSATELTTTDYKIGPGQVGPAPTMNTRNYNDWAEFSRANPSEIISIWGGGNTPVQSRANATQIQNDLINAGVNPANISIIPLSSPPPSRGSIPNGPSLW